MVEVTELMAVIITVNVLVPVRQSQDVGKSIDPGRRTGGFGRLVGD